MKQIFCSLILAAALAVPAVAQDAGASPPADAVPIDPSAEKGDRQDTADSNEIERRTARLDMMFGRLAKAEDERRARRIARHIMRRLGQSGSDTTDFLMLQAGKAMEAKAFGQALDLLDGVVRLQPEFAEGWNRRATVYFMMGQYGDSIADIEQVLRREPRHWGALAGLSMILVSLERKQEAIEVMDRALKIHPHLTRMKARRDKLMAELRGSDI